MYMRESLLFPYNAGARFQDAVYRKLGREAFEAVFAQGPRSTQQIMHPMAYFDMTAPVTIEPLGIAKIAGQTEPAQFRPIIEGAVGEFDHAILLRQYVGESEGAEAAQHWRAGWFRLYEHKKEAILCSPTSPNGIRRNPPARTSASISGFSRENGRKWRWRRPPRQRYPALAIRAALRYDYRARPSNL